MKQFFKFMFASAIGTFLSIMIAGVFLFVIFFAMLGGVISEASENGPGKIEKVEDNSILHLSLNKPIKDRTSENPFENFDINTMKSQNGLGLDKILRTIEKAKTDDKIKGIYLDLTFIPAGNGNFGRIKGCSYRF